MKVMGEVFFNKKRSRRGKVYNTFKLSGKRNIAGQNSGKFLINTEGVISNILEKSLR